MADTIIRAENVGKKYLINHQQKESYTALRDVLTHRVGSLGRNLVRPGRQKPTVNRREDFWALRNVSFEVKQGEVVGIIGRNGAGKSTLLKILSRITPPTTGSIHLKGRVASLLEVGTGFHPELTGRENIYLNGAILGMGRSEIKRKFDEIVEFAEVEKFLDTPVKRYSSGMYVRLAFAVAAHLEPEILVVDEVLAVGDAQFQKKCLGKMGEVANQEGRTVLFVSHQMAAISNLCPSCIVLDSGEISFQGKTQNAIEHYLSAGRDSQPDLRDEKVLQRFRPSWAQPYINAVRTLDITGQEHSNFALGSDIIVEMSFKAHDLGHLKAPVMGIVINHLTFGVVAGVNTRMSGFWPTYGSYEEGILRCILKRPPLLQGEYTIDVWLGDGKMDIDTLTGCIKLQVEEADVYGSGQVPFSGMGVLYLEPQWEFLSNSALVS